MAPPAHMRHASDSSSGARLRAPLDSTSAAAAVMAQGKLSSEAGMAAAHNAALQAKQRARQQHQEELCDAALTPPQQRTQEQVELLCGFLSSAHLLRNLQPTNIKELAQTMLGRACSEGELIYRQGDSANHFYLVLQGEVSFLAELPALKGLSPAYLRSLAHCFHAVQFEPREVLVRQGELADCLYVLKSGQVCILIDPNMTMAEVSSTAGGTAADSTAPPPELDTKKLVQVCLLGSGSIIGDMSVREGPGGAPRRSATVVALTELLTYKVPLREFRRRMPADVLEGMRHVASQKLVMNERQASSRTAAAAAGKDGHILLGGAAVPEAVLRGTCLWQA
ncbi:hypothetical protein OEZ86_002793 [Tetradesmus obliquus]|nr:hypothetical protein OEZ86_002793 [Tetradesmus obliquus]